MTATPDRRPDRVTVDGKFFRLGKEKFFVKGVTYGPFAPDAEGNSFADPTQTASDFKRINELGANTLRVYHVPRKWFLDLALEHHLRVLVDIAWHTHTCFLDSRQTQAQAREIVREAVANCAGHPGVFAFSVANEIPAEIVRWSGAQATASFLDELIEEAKALDPFALCTYVSFPPTEFLRLQNTDFTCFNVYLHEQVPFRNYLARLQMLADTRPLVLGEFGIDSIREGEERKCEILRWQIEEVCRAGLAGTIVYSFTDDWHRGGQQIQDWGFGLTTAQREPKPSFKVVTDQFRIAPYYQLPRYPRVSVVVACYNGEKTLAACLGSLEALRYPDYEVLLVDDGSTDNTAKIAQGFDRVRYIHQSNLGLSVARNTGILAANAEIIAFTDADCRADEDWLYHLIDDLLATDCAGIGGHNFLPSDDSWVATAVMASPGGPAHVMLTDRIAEHVPGCNMAFYRWALETVDLFDPIFTKAGDDVDICWRLQQHGLRIAFSPSGFVWHYRRSNVKAYLKQQAGYGEAEGLLARKHPEYFNFLGGGIWRGRIYSPAHLGVLLRRPVIYHGAFGSSLFQTLYAPEPAFPLMLCTTLEYHALITLPLFALSATFHFLLPVAIASLAVSIGVCILAAAQAQLPRKKRRPLSRPLVALLFFLQPLVRGWARYRWRLTSTSAPKDKVPLEVAALRTPPPEILVYGGSQTIDRYTLLQAFISELADKDWQFKIDSGWNDHDLEIFGGRWSRLRFTTSSEPTRNSGRIFRCRLQASWSFRARLLFTVLLGASLTAIGLWQAVFPWLWMLLTPQVLLAWYLAHENDFAQHRIAAVLDSVAVGEGLTPISRAVRKQPTA